MTYQAYETSINQGEPILLYNFSIGTASYLYTSADRQITVGSLVYAPLPIKRTAPVQSNDIRQQTMTVTIPRDASIATLFSTYPPGGDVLLTIYAQHYDDPDQQVITDWIGRVMSPTWKGSTIELACEPVYTSVQTMGLRRRWGLGCPHQLYGVACTLTAAAFAVPGTLTVVSGFNITSPSFNPPSGLSFKGGYVEWDSGSGYLERRTINAVSGTTLTVAYGSPELVVGLAVKAYPGCRHILSDCQAFGNNLNFGGQPNIPTSNPMDGSTANPVY